MLSAAIYAQDLQEAQGAENTQKVKNHKAKKAPKQKYVGWFMLPK